MLKVATALPNEPYREYKDVERVYSGSTEIDKILDKNGNVLFAVSKEVEGTPPLAYKGKEETNLKNYRIYGNTAGGESVGDRTGNLFDVSSVYANGYIDDSGNIAIIQGYAITTYDFIPIDQNSSYSIKICGKLNDNTSQRKIRVAFYSQDKRFLSRVILERVDVGAAFETLNNCYYIRLSVDDGNTDIMLNEGSTALPYEPYGYKVPVTVEGKNLFDGELTNGYHLDTTTGFPEVYGARFATLQPININQDEYCLTYNSTIDIRFMYSVFNGDTLIRRVAMHNNRYLQSGDAIDTTGGNKVYFAFYRSGQYGADSTMISNIMLNEGSTPLPYEPYHAPVTTPIYLPEPIKMVGDEAEYIDYAEQKQHRVRKNLWSGIVEQGGVTTVGVYADSTKRVRSRNIPTEPGTYTISSNLLIRAIYAYNEDNKIGVCTDTPLGTYSTPFTVPVGANNISIGMMKIGNKVEVDVTPSDFIWGQIEKGSEATTYEPYIENTDLDVTLPALPVLPGTNVLSVGTEVQPSNVYLKGRIKEIT